MLILQKQERPRAVRMRESQVTSLRRCRPPCRRVNGRAVRKRDVVGKLTLCRNVCRDVLVERREALELKACRLVRIEYGNRFFQLIANSLYWRGKVGIAGDKREGVGLLGYGVHQHLSCDIDIGAFFFELHNGCKMVRNQRTAFAGFSVKWHEPFGFLVEAFNELDLWKCRKRQPVIMLVQQGLGIFGVGLCFGGEVFDSENVIVWADNRLGEFHKIKPSVGFVLEQPVEEVESIYVNNRSGHVGSLKMLRPGLLPALRRIGSASAGGCNPSRGSLSSISFFLTEKAIGVKIKIEERL